MFSDAEAAALYDVITHGTRRSPEVVFCTEHVTWRPAPYWISAAAPEACCTMPATLVTPDVSSVSTPTRACWIGPAPHRHRMGFRRRRRRRLGRRVRPGHDDQQRLPAPGHRQRIAGLPDRDPRLARDGGRFVFGTRHPQARAWESWNPSNAFDLEDATGRKLRMWHEVESVVGDVVTFTETTAERDDTVLRVDRASLRFLDVPALAGFLTEAGFTIEDRYGDWRRVPSPKPAARSSRSPGASEPGTRHRPAGGGGADRFST